MRKKPDIEICSLSIEDINVNELETRIEMAANAAGCDCNGSGCNNCQGNATCKPN